MEAQHWKQLQRILSQVFAAPPGEEMRVLEQLCEGDSLLQQEVYELWVADQQGGETRQGIEAVALELSRQELLRVGERLGPFEVRREIGRGGMGVVYLAERTAPFQQQVAIKVISPERLGANSASAFARERQILASLEHPSIARVLDGGETAARLPFLVMEYVEGLPLGRELEGLAGDRLLVDRMLAVCEAVAYAQDRLVVHGDLKPENILVLRQGQGEQRIKLLDFGVASLISEGAAESAAFFSRAFASPEQQRGERLGPASDVYSLGQILRRLLWRPDGEMQAILRMACVEEARGRYANARELGADLRRWRERRAVAAYSNGALYEVWAWSRRNRLAAGAGALAFVSLVAGLGISLRQTSLTLAARNEALLEAQRAETSSRVAEGATLRAEAARKNAEAAQKRAEASEASAQRRYAEVFQLSTSLLSDFYEPAKAPDFPTAARKWMVEKAQARLAALTKENPADEKVREALADAHSKIGDLLGHPGNANLGDVRGAAAAYEKADQILAGLPAERVQAQRIQITIRRGDLATLTGEAAAASRFYEQAARAWQRLPARIADRPADLETGRMLALTLMKAAQGLILEGKFEAARPGLNQSLAIIAPVAQAAPKDSRIQRTYISALSRLAYLERQVGNLAEARGYLAQGAAVAEDGMRVLPDDSDLRQGAGMNYSQLGLTEFDLEKYEAAEQAYARGLELLDLDLKRDPKNNQTRGTWANLASNFSQCLWEQKKRERALALLRRALEMRDQIASAPNAAPLARLDAANSRMVYALRLLDSGDRQQALAEARAAVSSYSQLSGSSDFRVELQRGAALYDLSRVMEGVGLGEEARNMREQAREVLAPMAASNSRAAGVLKKIEEKSAAGGREVARKP